MNLKIHFQYLAEFIVNEWLASSLGQLTNHDHFYISIHAKSKYSIIP